MWIGWTPAQRKQNVRFIAYNTRFLILPWVRVKEWMQREQEEKRVEPNSGLGKAFNYLLKRWEALTQFLRIPGAPLGNNECERALKRAILHRKNSLSYRTEKGAAVGDVFMTVIATCRENGVDALAYLKTLQRYPDRVRENPKH